LTPNQVRSIKRHSEHVVVNFDPDTAGANATEKSLQLLIEEGMHVRILELDDGLDPDEFIKNKGADAYNARLDRATGYFLWLADRARRKFDMTSAESRVQGFETVLLPAIRRISDRIERAAVAGEVAEYLGVDRALVLKEFRGTPIPGRDNGSKAPAANSSRMTERVLVRSLLVSADAREVLVRVLPGSEAVRQFSVWPILETICALHDAGEIVSFESVDARLSDPAQKILLSGAAFADTSEEIFTREQATAYAAVLNVEDNKLRAGVLRAQLKEAERSGNMSEALRITGELTVLQRMQPRRT
jgi:DNA primase